MTAEARLPRVEKDAAGTFVLRDMPPLMAGALRRLPSLLSPAAPGIRDRLTGTPYPGDDDGTRHWERHGAPELAHLFQSAREVVEGDLRGLCAEGKARGRYRVAIPAGHLEAWLSSLSAGRVGLGEEHGFGEVDLESALPDEIRTEKESALLLVHLLGWVQGLLLESA